MASLLLKLLSMTMHVYMSKDDNDVYFNFVHVQGRDREAGLVGRIARGRSNGN